MQTVTHAYPLFRAIAARLEAVNNCRKSGNAEWQTRHAERINELVDELPSGSGLDAGVQFDWKRSTPDRLVFTTSYHHMDDAGGYDGWTDHEVIVTASLVYGLDIRITGRNRNDVKDYLAQTFADALSVEVEG